MNGEARHVAAARAKAGCAGANTILAFYWPSNSHFLSRDFALVAWLRKPDPPNKEQVC